MYNRRQFLGAIGRPAAAAVTFAVLDPIGVHRTLEALASYPGTPEEIAGLKDSYTGQFLKKVLTNSNRPWVRQHKLKSL